MNSKRHFLITAIMAIWVFLACPLGAEAQEFLEYTDAQLIKALQNFLWVPSGPDRDKQAYVIVAPWCPDSKAFYVESLKHEGDVQFRYILFSPLTEEERRKVANAILTQSKEALDAIYLDAKNSPGAGKDSAGNFVLAVTDSFGRALPALALKTRGLQPEYPTTIYLSRGGTKIVTGVSHVFDSFEKFSADIAPTPENRGVPSAMTPFVAGPPVVSEARPKKPLTRAEGGATLYVAPSVSCPPVARLAKGTGLETREETVVGGEKWYLFRIPEGPTLYGRQEDFYAG